MNEMAIEKFKSFEDAERAL